MTNFIMSLQQVIRGFRGWRLLQIGDGLLGLSGNGSDLMPINLGGLSVGHGEPTVPSSFFASFVSTGGN
jgi:hypothetical protein